MEGRPALQTPVLPALPGPKTPRWRSDSERSSSSRCRRDCDSRKRSAVCFTNQPEEKQRHDSSDTQYSLYAWCLLLTLHLSKCENELFKTWEYEFTLWPLRVCLLLHLHERCSSHYSGNQQVCCVACSGRCECCIRYGAVRAVKATGSFYLHYWCPLPQTLSTPDSRGRRCQVNVSLTSDDTDSQNASVQPGVYLCDEWAWLACFTRSLSPTEKVLFY